MRDVHHIIENQPIRLFRNKVIPLIADPITGNMSPQRGPYIEPIPSLIKKTARSLLEHSWRALLGSNKNSAISRSNRIIAQIIDNFLNSARTALYLNANNAIRLQLSGEPTFQLQVTSMQTSQYQEQTLHQYNMKNKLYAAIYTSIRNISECRWTVVLSQK